jgi:hypothetical protein
MKTIILGLLALACSLASGQAVPRTFKALNLSGPAATAFRYADGDSFDSCNFQQPVAHATIGGTARDLVFLRCNLINCDVPRDATVKQSLVVHLRTVVVEKVTVEDYASWQADMDKASATGTATHEATPLAEAVLTAAKTTVRDVTTALEAKRQATIDAAMTTATSARVKAGKWVPTAGLDCVPVLDAAGKPTSYQFTRQEIIP